MRTAPWLLAGAVALAAAPVGAQAPGSRGGVDGRVKDRLGRDIAGALVGIDGGVALAETDREGAFRLVNLSNGTVRLAIRRIGFAPETLSVRIQGPERTQVEIRLLRVSIPLATVVVQGRRDLRGPIAGFYERMDGAQGRFFTPDDIERSGARRMSDLLRSIPGVNIETLRTGQRIIRIRGSRTAPLIWLDGVPMASAEVDVDNFDPRTFAGVEVYSGSATVPIQYTGGRTASSIGGAILLWTKEGTPRPRTRKRDEATAAELLAQLADRDEVFTREEVDLPVVLIDDGVAAPIYPDSLFAAHLGGRVEVEFVVDHTGKPRMDTFGVVSSTHHSLADAVRRAIEVRRYVPAMRRGAAVAQLVQQPFEFVPDPSPEPRKPEN
jgi:TonB family protein